MCIYRQMQIRMLSLIIIFAMLFSITMDFAMPKDVSAANTNLVYSENFEKPSSLDTWEGVSSNSWTVERKLMNDRYGKQTKALRFSKENGISPSGLISKKFDKTITGNNVVSLWFNSESAKRGSEATINLNPGIITLRFLYSAADGRYVCLNDDNKTIYIQGYASGVWHNIKFVIDSAKGVSAYLDDEIIKENIPFKSSYKGLSGISFTDYYKYGSTYCYDDIKVFSGTDKSVEKVYSDPIIDIDDFTPVTLNQGSESQANFYVSPNGNDSNTGTIESPFRTIEKARDVVRQVNQNMTGDIYIYLMDGTYYLDKPITLDDKDSGTNGYNILYKAYDGAKPIISGGKKITGWTLFDAEKNIYKATPDEIIDTRQLFVDEVRATRARSTDGLADATFDDQGNTTTDTFLATWKNLTDMEMVYKEIWTNPRCGIERVELKDDKLKFILKQPAWRACRSKGITAATVPWYYENAYELLDTPGEWYQDKTGAIGGTPNAFYYMPREGQDINNVEVIAPTLEKLVTAMGSSVGNPIHNIQFVGISFKDTTWLRPSTNLGLPDAQNNVIRNGVETIIEGAAFTTKYMNSFLFERCNFYNLGGTAINMYAGGQNVLIEGCAFVDVAANGIQIGEYLSYNNSTSENFFAPADRRYSFSDIRVENNYLDKVGVEYRSACVIGVAFARNMVIQNNDILNCPYGGVHFGWGWGEARKSISENNKVNNNYMYNTVAELDDVAAIYTLGAQNSSDKPSEIRNNYIEKNGDHALYFDNGSTWWVADNNVMLNSRDVNINLSSPDKRDIVATRSYSNNDSFWNKGTRTKIDKPIVITSETQPIIDEIRKNAGIREPYLDIKKGFEKQVSGIQMVEENKYKINVNGKQLKVNVKPIMTDSGLLVTLREIPQLLGATIDWNDKDQTIKIKKGANFILLTIDKETANVNGNEMPLAVPAKIINTRVMIPLRIVSETLGADVNFDVATNAVKVTSIKDIPVEIGRNSSVASSIRVLIGSSGLVTPVLTNIDFEKIQRIEYSSVNPDILQVNNLGKFKITGAGNAAIKIAVIVDNQKIEKTINFDVYNYGTGEKVKTAGYDFSKEIADIDNWYVDVGGSAEKIDGGIRVATPSGPVFSHGGYKAKKFENELLTFDLQINANGGWPSVMLRDDKLNLPYDKGNGYMLTFGKDTIDVQRYNLGKRTVIFGTVSGFISVGGPGSPNTFYKYGEKFKVQVGAINEKDGVRIIININGKNVINYLDNDPEKLTEPGYFKVYARSGNMELFAPQK